MRWATYSYSSRQGKVEGCLSETERGQRVGWWCQRESMCGCVRERICMVCVYAHVYVPGTEINMCVKYTSVATVFVNKSDLVPFLSPCKSQVLLTGE